MSRMEREDLVAEAPDGSWERSGIESQRMSRSFEEPLAEIAVQTFDDSIREPAENDVVLREPLVCGSWVNVPEPE